MLSGFITSNSDTFIGMMGIFIMIVFFIGSARIQFEKATKKPSEFYKNYLDISDYNKETYSSGIAFDNFSQRIKWIRYNTSIYPVIFIYILEIIYILCKYINNSTLNSGIIVLFLWFPFFVNTFLFKKKNNK
jgi:hypothetical protein